MEGLCREFPCSRKFASVIELIYQILQIVPPRKAAQYWLLIFMVRLLFSTKFMTLKLHSREDKPSFKVGSDISYSSGNGTCCNPLCHRETKLDDMEFAV
jgi:hypothetical protein